MDDKTRTTLRFLREAAIKAAGTNIRDPHASPLEGYCASVSVIVRGILGGDLVTGKIDNCRHYWNRLPSGEEVDLTSCQFGGDGLNPLKKGRKTKSPELTDFGTICFGQLMLEYLRE